MTEHLGAEPDEQTDDRRGYRNGSYERKLTTRVGTIELEVPRDREGTFQTALFQRYQRSEKALVLTFSIPSVRRRSFGLSGAWPWQAPSWGSVSRLEEPNLVSRSGSSHPRLGSSHGP